MRVARGRYASQTSCFEMSYGFASGIGSSPCGLTAAQSEIGELLRSTRVTGLHRYNELVRPSASHRYSAPHGSTTWSSPFASRQEVPTFHTRACARLTHAFMPAIARAVDRLPPSFIPSQRQELGFDGVPTLSTHPQRFTFVRLPGAHLTGSSRLFPNRSPLRPLGPAQHPVVWTPVLQPESEGPSLISHAARLLPVGRAASFLRRRGAPSSA